MAGLLAAGLGLLAGLGDPTLAAVKPPSPEAVARHWAYQPVRRPETPKVQASPRVANPIDAFLLAKLEPHGLGFAPPADRRTWLRRVYYDLVGLPPSYAETEAFLRDASKDAAANVVDRLLADARYGERWGRHWLDVARYADTKDLVLLYGRDAVRPYAYTYRDYVIRAFNQDLPFDQFVRDQLAADLVQPKVEPWRLAGLGFLTLGRLFDNNPHDQIDDQIDTVSRGLLGLTVACARCHDHKYDAITMEDYYGLYGVFASTEQPTVLPLIENPQDVPGGLEFEAKLEKARDELEAHIDSQYERLTAMLRGRIGDYLVRAATTKPDLTETTQFALSLTPDDFRPSLMLRTRRFVEQRARPDDRVFALWARLMELPDDDFTKRAPEVLADTRRPGGPAASWNRLITEAFATATLASKADVARTYGKALTAAFAGTLTRSCLATAYQPGRDERELLEIVAGVDGPLWFPRRDTPNHMSRPDKDRYGGLALNLDKIAAHASNAPPARAMVVADLPEPYESRVFLRGNPSRPGPLAPRGFLGFLNHGLRPVFKSGSGRLELAQAIVAPSNPLTARVLVNRFWMHHFGEPLVSSPADFGARSEAPENPELLDWLASEFVGSGWRLKPLHRLIVLSSAYAQTSAPPPVAPVSASGAAADPENRWLSHFPRRRLDLEAMRDSLLAVSGRLNPILGGRPVDIAGDPQNRRRTVYGLVDRQNLPGLFRAFDFAVPDTCVERRPRTSVPQQALFAMNSPFVMEQAKALASTSASEPQCAPASGRVQWLFRQILARDPSPGEIARSLSFVTAAGADGGPLASLGPWEQFAQVLLVSNEAVFVD